METVTLSKTRASSLKGLLDSKVAIITGASRGIGAATARVFSEAGTSVVLAARTEKQISQLADEINSIGGEALSIPTDVGDPASVDNLVKQTIDKFGKLDIAFNNAGEGHMPKPLADIALEDFDNTIRVQLRGVFLSMKYEIPAMLQNNGGSIVNMSSTAGLQGVPVIASYVAGKHGIIGLTKTAALDYAAQNIRVNCIAPGPILTERLQQVRDQTPIINAVPVGRIGQPAEVAYLVAWLSSDLAGYITGATIPIDGGRLTGSYWRTTGNGSNNEQTARPRINQ
jgi:NAD(P)-dependent dehydrogenase (short-subunit alcohol dehydrogenase family)